MDAANSSSSSLIEAISILVVDDDNDCLSIITAILKKFNYQVVAVQHAQEALYTLRLTGSAFDLVVSDVHMPDMNGFELQQVITEEFDLPVILMSVDDKEGIALKGLEGGAAYFMMKPISPDDVRDLWQFAAMKKRKNQTVIIEENPQENDSEGEKDVEDEILDQISTDSSDEGATTNEMESKNKNPSREGSEEKSPSSSRKRSKIVWTNTLHNCFLEAIRSIGLDRAVPKKILELMSVPGLTRENVASHLQKYRIFLRRVSDASCKIQYSPKKGLRISPQSRVGNLQNRSQFNVATPLPNIGASSSTQFGQSRLFPNNGAWYKPPMGTSTLTPLHTCIRPMPNSFEARALIASHVANVGQDHAGIAISSSFGAFPNTSINGVSTQNTYQTNYVGYRLSSLQSLVESSKNNEEPQAAMVANVTLAENYEANDNGQELLSNGIADVQEPALIPIYDLAAFNMASAQQALDEGGFETTWPYQLTNVLDQPQQQNVGGETNITSNLYDDVVQWDKFVNASYSFDQAFNQAESSQLQLMTNSQGLATSSQINGIAMEPNNERNDDEFLESLLAPYGEGHHFHGCNDM